MFKPQRLIYQQLSPGNDPEYTFKSPLLQKTQKVVTEGFPEAFKVLAEHPVEMVEEEGIAVKGVIDGTQKALKGTLKGAWELGVNTTLKRVTLQDLGAAPTVVAVKGAKAVKAMTWDTGRNILKGQGKEAAKSFFKDGLWGAIKMPFQASWNGVKGLANLGPDVARGGFKTVGHVAGLKMNKEGELEPGEHGVIPALGSILKGAGKALSGLFGKRLRNKVVDNQEFRFDTSVKWGGGSSHKEKSNKSVSNGEDHGHDTPVAVGPKASSAFGKKGGSHAPAAAEEGHAKSAKAEAHGHENGDKGAHAPKAAADHAAPATPAPATPAPATPAPATPAPDAHHAAAPTQATTTPPVHH